MTATVQDVLKANLVLVGISLLDGPEKLEVFHKLVGSEMIAGVGIAMNIPSGVTEQGRTFTLPKDRITLDILQSRSTISTEYPSKEHLDRLAEVAGLAINNSDVKEQQLRALGYNIELTFDQDSENSALGYLADRLFTDPPPRNDGWVLTGGSGQLIFEDGGRRWTVKLEPRLGEESTSRVFLSVNLHIVGEPCPQKSQIEDSLQEVWKQSYEFVNRLERK